MTKGIMIALTNPMAADRVDEYNHWYNNIHGKEITSLKGFASMTRYEAKAQVVPPGGKPAFSYLALYELDDIDTAVQSLAGAADNLNMSDSVDLAGGLGIAFQKIFSTKD